MKNNKKSDDEGIMDEIMPEKRLDFWTALIFLGAIAILVWAFLKASGIIHSPAWIEMVPYFGGGISILGGAYKLGKIKRGIEDTEQKVDRILRIEDRFSKVENEHKLAMSGRLKLAH